MATFWATFGEKMGFFIPPSDHTGHDPTHTQTYSQLPTGTHSTIPSHTYTREHSLTSQGEVSLYGLPAAV